jgi:hypothetical protein
MDLNDVELSNAVPRPSTLVEKPRYKGKNLSSVLYGQIRQHNEVMSGKGLKYLRSFLSQVVDDPSWAIGRPILNALNGHKPASAVDLAKGLLSQQYDSAHEHFRASQIALLVKKYPFAGSEEDAVRNGRHKFCRAERRNRIISRLIRARGPDEHMHHVRSFMARLLGDKPDLEKLCRQVGWGPGSCVGVTGRATNFARKFLSERWTCTPTCLPYALTFAKRYPMFWELLGLTRNQKDGSPMICVDVALFEERFRARIALVDYNKIAFVPKDADEHRTIASEPLFNQWIQKAIDLEMRQRLKRFGIDLRDQRTNQVLAREGSLGGYNARCTVDLKNASGSMCTEFVRSALSYVPDWFDVLNCTRSPAYRFPDDTASTPYAGFVSMGNGFCFPLETALFAAICSAAHKYCGTVPDFRCYGDDIVIRQNEALVALELLRRYGFKANTDKTFLFGGFRESCGADWYNGENVRPVVLDSTLDSIEDRVRFHNALARLPRREGVPLSGIALGLLPPFMKRMVRPFADETDECVDGRHFHDVTDHPDWTHERVPFWYGLLLTPQQDEECVNMPGFTTALHYAGLGGHSSQAPFAVRRETRMRVARFSHWGGTSNWIPPSNTQVFSGYALTCSGIVPVNTRYRQWKATQVSGTA